MNTKQILNAAYGDNMDVVEPGKSVSWGAVISEDVTKYTLDGFSQEVLEELASELKNIKNPMFKPFVTVSEEGTAVVLTEATPTSEGGEGIAEKQHNIQALDYGILLGLDSGVFLEQYFNDYEITDDEDKNLYNFAHLLMAYGYIHEYVADEDYDKYAEEFAKELKEKHFTKGVALKEAQKTYKELEKEDLEEYELSEKAKEVLGLSHLTSDARVTKDFAKFDLVEKLVNRAYSEIESDLTALATKYKLQPAG